MPFSRYQIRNEFSLADPELYKAADKDDPEALLEGVAMAGLVGVLRQLGDLAEFAAEIFHGLHEEVMVTATRGHGLLVRVQQLESDFPSIERAFLSQTGHSSFFSSPGIGWHPNLQTDQNLITKGDLPRFVMDSYEECRGPPRLFLLDKFDVAGAGSCLKRYTDPSFYKVEASSFEMRNTEAQRDTNIRKTKKKGSRWKNGETPDVFQPSHVKLHQLLMEERMQNRADETARHVKLKKREIKFPFDTETGKGYMETLLSSPPEDKLVHEVPKGNTVILPMQNESPFESPEGNTVNSPMQNETPFQSPIVDKSISMEHVDNAPQNLPERLPENVPEVYSEIEEEVEEKHISVDNHKADEIISDGYESDDVGENYVDALATMESEIETETETKANSDPNVEQIQSQFSDSQSDNEINSNEKKMESFSYTDNSSTSTDNTPRSATFASTEIPFRPRILSNQVSDVGAISEESGLKESGLIEMSSSDIVEENKIDSEAIAASTVDDLSLSHRDSEDGISNSTLEISNVEEETLGSSLEEVDNCDADVEKHSEEISHSPDDTCSLVKGQSTDDVLESKSDPVSYFSENEKETELNDKESILSESESKAVNVVDDDEDGDGNTENNLSVLEEEKESMEREPESAIPVPDDIDTNESKNLSAYEDTELEKKKVESIEMDEDDGVSTTENGIQDSDESGRKKESRVESLIPPEPDSIPSATELTESDSVSYAENDHSYVQFLDSNPKIENDVDNPSVSLDENLSVIEKTDENGDVQPDLDSQTGNNDSMSTETATNLHIDNIVTSVSNQDVESESINNQEFEDPIESTPSVVATNESTLHISEPVFKEPYITDLPQMNHFNETEYPLAPVFTGMNMLPQLTPPINLEEMPPLPPLPPMQWRMGKPQNTSFFPTPNDPQNITNNHFPPPFPQIMSQPPQDPNENPEFQKTQHDHEVLQTESSSHIQESENEVKNTEEEIVPQPPQIVPQPPQLVPQPPQIVPQLPINVAPFQIVSTSGEDERPNGIRPMKVQRPRTPLIDAVAAHDKSKLRKVTERVRPQVPEEEERENLLQLRKVSERSRPEIPKEEERDTLLEQIRAKSFNLKPAVQTRPSIQGPSTNLRVAAILEKANAIRHAFAGSDDDEDDDDSWSDS